MPTIDKWHVPEWKDEHLPGGRMLEESSFATLFPRYREKYLREVWPAVTKTLKKVGLGCELNLVVGSKTVKTTRKTTDPYIIMKARDLIKLLARSIPVAQAVKILQDKMECDIIKIGGFVRNKARFVKRRQRLLGPNGNTLKAIELLTHCYVLVQGTTVSAMGSFKGLKQVRRIVEDCMQNVHPIYNIKEMMTSRAAGILSCRKIGSVFSQIKAHVANPMKKSRRKEGDEAAAKAKAKANAKKKDKKKKYTPFPPAQQPSKVDLQLESGEYFLSEEQRKERKRAEKMEKSKSKQAERKRRREEAFVAPSEGKKEKKEKKSKKKKKKSDDVSDVRDRLLKKAKVSKKGAKASAESYLASVVLKNY